jgi:predicted house-cleaning NTP pyrophosphatase (Maf/HAM1 superfamily)
MAPLEPFVVDVVGEDPSGVLGLPLPLLARLMAQLGIVAP